MQDQLVGLKDIEKISGVSLYRLRIAKKAPIFPKQVNKGVRPPLWKLSDIEVWLKQYKRIPCYIGK